MRRVMLAVLLGATLGCRWGADDAPVRGARRQGVGVPAGGAPMATDGAPRKVADAIADGPTVDQLPEGTPGVVVFIVIDTLRADAVTACGAREGSTRVIDGLATKGATLSCDVYAPATWTLPSHAAFFTGLGASQHPLHRKGLRLADDAETLAETFEARGYQTAMVSGNPVLQSETGLHQGFHVAQVAGGLSHMRGDVLTSAVRQTLSQLDRNRPLFLFVNVFDAHEPYPAIPAGTPNLPEQGTFSHRSASNGDGNSELARYRSGQMPAEEAEAWVAGARAGYAYGVQQADESLGKVLRMLERQGWTQHGARLVITSDHGELLGEHQDVGHDGPPWEGVTRVPLVFAHSGPRTVGEDGQPTPSAPLPPLTLPSPLPGGAVYHLVRDGRLPDTMPPLEAISLRYKEDSPRNTDGAAVWLDQGRKLLWVGGKKQRFDLKADPGEVAGTEALTPEELSRLDKVIAEQGGVKTATAGQGEDAKVMEVLKAVGYVE